MILPAKLSFLAQKYDTSITDKPTLPNRGKKRHCVHGIRAYGERRLLSASESSEDAESKPEEPHEKGIV